MKVTGYFVFFFFLLTVPLVHLYQTLRILFREQAPRGLSRGSDTLRACPVPAEDDRNQSDLTGEEE